MLAWPADDLSGRPMPSRAVEVAIDKERKIE